MSKKDITQSSKYKKIMKEMKKKGLKEINSPEMIKLSQKLDKIIVKELKERLKNKSN